MRCCGLLLLLDVFFFLLSTYSPLSIMTGEGNTAARTHTAERPD
jgi:hypothetical protein